MYLSEFPCIFVVSDTVFVFIDLSLKLQSSAVAYKYGISGPWWYGSGATIQVLLFAQVRTALFSCDVVNLTQTRDDPTSSLQNLNSMPHTLTLGSRSLVLVGERLPTAFSSSSGEFPLRTKNLVGFGF